MRKADYMVNVVESVRLTVVQGDEEYPLNHVVDVKLLAELLPRPKRAADLRHRVIVVIDAV